MASQWIAPLGFGLSAMLAAVQGFRGIVVLAFSMMLTYVIQTQSRGILVPAGTFDEWRRDSWEWLGLWLRWAGFGCVVGVALAVWKRPALYPSQKTGWIIWACAACAWVVNLTVSIGHPQFSNFPWTRPYAIGFLLLITAVALLVWRYSDEN
jgi:hypothetical protein